MTEQNTWHDAANLANTLALEAQGIALRHYGRAVATRKPDGSDVTEADQAIQEMMVDRIRSAYPDHVVIGEEAASYAPPSSPAGSAPFCWVIDPIDGTRNYVRRVPMFSTAIAVLARGVPVVGVIRSLTTDDAYVAVRGAGTRHNGQPVRLEAGPLPSDGVVAVQSTLSNRDTYIHRALSGTAILRNLGSTALHLALTGAGACDGMVACECKLWDVAAGALLVEEAGGVCTDWAGRPLFPIDAATYEGEDLPIVAAAPGAHEELLKRIQAQLGKGPGGR